jgi:hypothetical protein
MHSLAGHLDDDVRPGQGGLDRLAQPTARLPMFTCAHERRTPPGIARCRASDFSTRWIPEAMGIHFREGMAYRTHRLVVLPYGLLAAEDDDQRHCN